MSRRGTYEHYQTSVTAGRHSSGDGPCHAINVSGDSNNFGLRVLLGIKLDFKATFAASLITQFCKGIIYWIIINYEISKWHNIMVANVVRQVNIIPVEHTISNRKKTVTWYFNSEAVLAAGCINKGIIVLCFCARLFWNCYCKSISHNTRQSKWRHLPVVELCVFHSQTRHQTFDGVYLDASGRLERVESDAVYCSHQLPPGLEPLEDTRLCVSGRVRAVIGLDRGTAVVRWTTLL